MNVILLSTCDIASRSNPVFSRLLIMGVCLIVGKFNSVSKTLPSYLFAVLHYTIYCLHVQGVYKVFFFCKHVFRDTSAIKWSIY